MSDFTEITVDEWEESTKVDESIECIADWTLLEVGTFFRTHDRHMSYILVEEGGGVNFDAGFAGFEGDYAKYGIYFRSMHVVNKNKTYLFLLSVDELLHDGKSLQEIRECCEKGKVELIISDLENASTEVMLQLYGMLEIENCVILNKITIDTVYTETDDSIEFLDFTGSGILDDSTETSQRLNALKQQMEYVRSVGKSKRFAIKLEDTDNKIISDIFDGLVATFMPRGYKFYTNSYKNSKYFSSMIRMYSREYMKITDYFDSVRDHLNFGVYVANEIDRLASDKYRRCDLFLVQIENNQDPMMQLIVLPLNDEGQIQRQSRKVTVSLNDIKYSEVDPKYLPYADQYLTSCDILVNESLHCSNTFCMELNGRKFIAVFLGFTNSMKCKVAPLSKSINWAPVEISFEKYAHVLPITIFEDGEKIARSIYGDKYDKLTTQRKVVDYMDYFAVSEMKFKTNRMNAENCEVPEEAIGIYFISSCAARARDCSLLFSRMEKKSLWDMEFLTYYGGPLPSLRKEFIFEYGDLR